MVSCGRGPLVQQGNNSFNWAAGEKMCDELTIPYLPVPMREEVELEKGVGAGGRCFKSLISFSLSYSDFVSNKLIWYL